MKRVAGLILAGGFLLVLATPAKAQFGLSIGNPYGGGVYVGNPGYGYGGYGGSSPYYGAGTTYYSSGYRGYAPVTPYVGNNSYGGYRYATPYRNYGYNNYRPFGLGGRRFGGFRRW